jgi:RNA polymerase sigma factor (sigma-70 family)
MLGSEHVETQLISDCQKGDRNAQKQLYELYSGKMMGVCLRYCKDKETAKDLLHDGFLKVFTHLDSFEGKGSFEGWIRRIMVNTALEYLRKQSEEGYNLDIEEAFTLTNGEIGALEKMQAEELIRIIQKLPDTYRMTFNLFVVEGYSHKEISEMMNITESSSRVYLTRARQLLQSMLRAK